MAELAGVALRGLPRRLGTVVEPADGESLPSWIDRIARLHQARLETARYPQTLLESRPRENFTWVMRQALRRHRLPLIARMLTAGSPLIDHGYVDADGLAAVYNRLADGGEFRQRETGLYGLIVMDMALRSFA